MNQLTSQPNHAELPDAWVTKLFARFAAMYGKHWLDMWGDVPIAEVKAAWAADLGRFSGDQLRKALDHCKSQCKFPPTLPEFVGLCRSFAEIPDRSRALPDYSKAEIDPRVRAEIARFLTASEKRDPKDWARRILAEEAAGTYRHVYGIECAKRALGFIS